jgi:hypothetical protein
MPAIAHMVRSYKLHRAIRVRRSGLRPRSLSPNALVHSNHPPNHRSFIPSTDAAGNGPP